MLESVYQTVVREFNNTVHYPVQILAFSFAFVALYVATKALNKKFNLGRKSESHGNDELKIRIDDIESSLNTKITALEHSTQRLERVVDQLLELQGDTELKKKLELSSKPAPQEAAKPKVAKPAPLEEPTNYKSGLTKTRKGIFSRLVSAFSSNSSQEELREKLEEALITSDLGTRTTQSLLDRLQQTDEFKSQNLESCINKLSEFVEEILTDSRNIELSCSKQAEGPTVILVIGVNGAGKTTTIGKLSNKFTNQGKKVLVAAGDTFRAAAVEQLEIWGDRAGVEVITADENAKPSTVAYKAVHRGIEGDFDVVILDTAGRLNNRKNLMSELEAMVSLIRREQPGAPHETVLVVDATSGQNALQQARDFNESAKLDGVIITKLDGTPKGGIVVAIKDELDIPVRYIGIGEGVEDLREFNANEYAKAIFSTEGLEGAVSSELLADKSVTTSVLSNDETDSDGSDTKPKARRARRRARA